MEMDGARWAATRAEAPRLLGTQQEGIPARSTPTVPLGTRWDYMLTALRGPDEAFARCIRLL